MTRMQIATAVAAATLVAAPAWSAEFSYDFVACSHSTQRMLEAGPDLVAFGTESWGIVATSTSKEWESATTRCVGYLRIVGGKSVGKGMCRWVHAGGDTAVGEWEMTPSGQNHWTWIAGTGKLAGIKGGGTFEWVTRAKAVEAGTGQSCRRDWGQYTLP